MLDIIKNQWVMNIACVNKGAQINTIPIFG